MINVAEKKEKMMKTRYMHTMDGKPAQFYEDNGICFNNKRIKLADSLAQIRREQRRTLAIDLKQKRLPFKYGYVTVLT